LSEYHSAEIVVFLFILYFLLLNYLFLLFNKLLCMDCGQNGCCG